MKGIMHQSKKNVFTNWLHNYLKSEGKKYIWPQICYERNTARLIHIVFEKNQSNEEFVEWPATNLGGVPFTNINFTVVPPILEDGNEWDFNNWYNHALNCTLSRDCTRTPVSFWDWRSQTWPQDNLTCDLDFLYLNSMGKYIGIEATEIYCVDENKDCKLDVFEHFKRLFLYRKGNTGGFNIDQLKAQKNLLASRNGKLYMLFHQFIEKGGKYILREDRVLLIEINDSNILEIENLIKNKKLSDALKREISFNSIDTVFKSLGC